MDKLKNLVNPGSKKDDEVLYGRGNVDDPVLTGNNNTVSGQGSHFGNSRTAGAVGNDTLSSSTHPTSSTRYDDTARNDPLSTSTNPTGGSQYDTGTAGRGIAGSNEPTASRMPGSFDDVATTASIRSGVPGQSQSRSGLTGTNDSALLDKPLPREPTSTGTGLLGSPNDNSTETGSSLTGKEYPDRSVGSTRISDQNYAPETGRSFPLVGNQNNTSSSNYPSGQTGSYPADGAFGSTTAGPHSSNLANKADPRVDSDLDGSRTTGASGLGSGTGPIANSANQGSLGRDQTLASGTGVGGNTTSRSGAGAGAGAGAGIGSGTGVGAGVGGAENWEHDHNRHGHTYEGDPCATGDVAPTGALHTAGPHVTDTANRLDPNIAGDGSMTGNTGHHHGHHHDHHSHHGRDAASASGIGAGAYEASSEPPGRMAGTSTGSGLDSSTGNTGTVGTSSTGKTAGPHKSDLLNKLDPRVDSDLSKQQPSTNTTGTGFGSSTAGTSDPYSSSKDHHLGRDTGLAGAGSAAAYEVEKHHGDNRGAGTTSGMSSSDPYSSSGVDPRVDIAGTGHGKNTDSTARGKDNHLGRDATLGAGASGLAYEAERAHGKPTQSSTIPSNTSGAAYDNTTGSTGSGYDQAGTALAGSGHQPVTGYSESQPQKTSHHLGRDAALGAGAGGAAYEAQKMHDIGRNEPGTQVSEQAHPGASVATYPSPGYGNEGALDPSQGHGHGHGHGHRKEDAAIVGGAGAGTIADHEFSKKDEKALAKEHRKEEKALEKEHAKHEKAIEKDERKHEKALEKEEKREEKSEKKHGGLLGLLHRDKGDKNGKEEPAQPRASGHLRKDGADFDGDMSANTGATTLGGLEHEHGTQSGVHDNPVGHGIGSGITTHDAYGTHEGQNKLHKDPPAKVLESRGLDQSGSGY